MNYFLCVVVVVAVVVVDDEDDDDYDDVAFKMHYNFLPKQLVKIIVWSKRFVSYLNESVSKNFTPFVFYGVAVFKCLFKLLFRSSMQVKN